jgi:flagellar biosynthesis anti-sigma factor FlgM
LLDRKVNDPNLSSVSSAGGSRTQETGRTGPTSRQPQTAATGGAAASGTTASDDIHLSELVRSLRSLAADSPERQARIEQIARAYANGTYAVDAHATASGIIDDALRHS